MRRSVFLSFFQARDLLMVLVMISMLDDSTELLQVESFNAALDSMKNLKQMELRLPLTDEHIVAAIRSSDLPQLQRVILFVRD